VNPKKALIYRRGGLGDTLLVFPVLECLTSLGYEVTAIGNCEYFEIAKHCKFLSTCYYDCYPEVINKDYHLKIFFSKDGISPFPNERKWIVDYYFEVLNLPKRFSLKLPLKAGLKNNPLKGKAVIHAGSGSFKKIPPFELFLRIESFLKDKGFDVIYLVGEADAWIKEQTDRFWECLSPLEIALSLKEALLFVGVDSGISHLACYLGVKSFVFYGYGPTDPVVWKPIGKEAYIVSACLRCSPCFPKVCESRKCLSPEKLFALFKEKFYRYFK